jgi:hypothetical protein
MKNQWLGKAISVLFGLAGSLAFLYLVNCNGAKCCPNITVFTVDHEWVCPANCPGGGITTVNYTVEFWKDKEHCQPPKDFKILIKNVTDNIDLPPLRWNNPKVGVYEGSLTLHVTKDTTYALVATGEQECGGATKELKVNVVDNGDFGVLHFHGKLDPPSLTTLVVDTQIFGPGITIKGIKVDEIPGLILPPNYKKFIVNVIHNSKDLDGGLWAGNPIPSKSFQGHDPNGTWTIEVLDPKECDAFDQLPEDQREIRLLVYLECKCQ